MSSGIKRILKIFTAHWGIKLLSILLALLVWLYVEMKDKVPFQVQLKIGNIPKGYKVFPEEILVTGKISEKFHREDILRCFKVYLKWNGRGKYATVEVKTPLPNLFVEIETVYPQRVEVRKVNR